MKPGNDSKPYRASLENTLMLWILGAAQILVWFVLKFVFHKGGFVNTLLLGGISFLVVQFAAERRARFQRHPSE